MAQIGSSFIQKGDTLYLVASKEAEDFLKTGVDSGFINSMHIISAKGIFESLVECCTENRLGFDITADSDYEDDVFLKGDTKYTIIVSVSTEQEEDFVNMMFAHDVDTMLLGHVTKGELRMDDRSFGFIGDYVRK